MLIKNFNHHTKLQPTLGGLAYWSAVCPMINVDLEYVEGLN
jgi:hypothetical protein